MSVPFAQLSGSVPCVAAGARLLDVVPRMDVVDVFVDARKPRPVLNVTAATPPWVPYREVRFSFPMARISAAYDLQLFALSLEPSPVSPWSLTTAALETADLDSLGLRDSSFPTMVVADHRIGHTLMLPVPPRLCRVPIRGVLSPVHASPIIRQLADETRDLATPPAPLTGKRADKLLASRGYASFFEPVRDFLDAFVDESILGD